MKNAIIAITLITLCYATLGQAETQKRSGLREKLSNNWTTLAATNEGSTSGNYGYREKISDALTLLAIVDTPDGHTEDVGYEKYVDTVWRYGGASEDGRAVWGFFYVDPLHVWWGSYNNPELYVKIWFDPSGRIDVNYFHVSYDDISVRTGVRYDGDGDWDGWIGDVASTATRDQRFVQHRLDADGSRYYESERK